MGCLRGGRNRRPPLCHGPLSNIHGYPWTCREMHGNVWISMDIHGFAWTSMDIHGYPRTCIFVVMIQIIEIRVRRGRVRRVKMATRAAKRKNVMNEGPAEALSSVQKSLTETLKKTIPTQTHQTMLFGLVWPTCLWEPSKIGSAGRSGVYIYSVFDPMNSNKRFWGAVQKGDPEKGRSYIYMVF